MKKLTLLLSFFIFISAVYAQTPIAYFPFTGNANDAVGTNNGTVNGATLTTDRFGNANSAYSFDGVDDFIGIGSINFANNDYTISYWVNVNATTPDIAVVSGNDPAALNQTFILSGFSGGVGRFLHRNPSGSSGGVDLAGVQPFTLGQWRFVTSVKQGTTLTNYVNGVIDNTITNPAATNISSAIFLELGRLMSSAFTPIYHLNGKIDEVKIYNTALSASQIAIEYNTTAPPTLIAHYPFTGNAGDSSVNANHGTVNGATLTTDRNGEANKAYRFNGASNYIEVADANSIDLNINFTISTWLFPTGPGSLPQEGGIIINKEFSYEIVRFTNGTIQFALSSNGTGNDWNYVNTSIVAPLNTWTHITLVKTGSVVTVYKNGTSEFTDNSQPVSLAANTSNLRIGGRTFTPHFFDGKLDEVKIYNTALSASQIAAEYNATAPPQLIAHYPFTGNAGDSCGNANHGTVNGATLAADRFGVANKAYSFDGVDDRINAPLVTTETNNFTLQGWVKLSAVGGTQMLFYNGNSFSNGWGLLVNNTGHLCAIHGGVILSQTPFQPALNTWYHVAMTRSAGNTKVFVNGVEIHNASLAAPNTPTNNFCMGNMSTGTDFFNGNLDDVKIYNTALSAAQVLADYTNANQISLPIAIVSGGSNGTCNNANSNNMNGGNASGVGCGGGGAGFWGGHGGSGYFGGGGGGAAGLNTPNRIGGDGGSGAIAMALTNSNGIILSNIFLISGSSFTIPAGVAQVKVFAIGAGGGGAGSTSSDGSSGGGGGAGGVAFKKYSVAPGDIMTYTIGVGGLGGIDANNGSAGTQTQATINGITITGNGGSGGLFNNNIDAVGGSFSGGDGGAAGGNGKGTTGDSGGGAGGGIGGGFNPSVTCAGGIGSNAQDIDILFSILQNSATNIDILPALIAHYPLNANAGDSSGNNLHGTIHGAPTFTTDRHGNANSAIAFDGNVANRIEVDDNLLLHSPSITLSAWVKLNSLGSIRTFVDKPMGTSFTDSWHFGTENSNFSSWHFDAPTFTPYSQVTSPGISGQWVYVVNTFDNNTKQHKLYIDGILKATNTFNSTIGYDNSKLYIGAAIENGNIAYPMDGAIDEVKIYGGAMTASQIMNEYQNDVIDNKPGSGNGISLDGMNDYVQLPTVLDGATQFTVDFWIKTTENRSSGTYWQKPSILGNGNPSGPDGDFGISTSNGFIGVWHGFCCGDQSFETTTAINDNQWHHVAAVNDGSNVVLFVDGIQLAGSIPTGGGALQNAARPWRLGMINSCCSGDTPHQGTFDEFRIWNIALTQSQIRDRMCKKITTTDALYANLSEYLNFDEKFGATLFDGSANGTTATLHNGATRVTSGAPIGNTSSHDYSGSSSSVNAAHPTRGDDVTVTLTSGAAQGVHVYNVSEAPSNRTGVQGLETNDGYFGTFVVGGSSPTFNTVYNYDGVPNISDENGLSLFSRNDNSTASWIGELATINTSTNTLTKNGIVASQKEFILGANDPGNISSDQTSCFAIVPNPLTGTIAYNGASGVTYQWQDSTVGGTWQNISGATNVTPLVLSTVSSPKYYRRLATLGSLTLSSNIVFLDIKNAIAPNILPTNQWNLYAYDGTSVDSVGVTFKGSYTRTSLGINTITDYGSGTNPSAATGYAGCALTAPNNTYSLYAKRKGFPTGSYALNIPQHDDEIKIFKDGILVTAAACCNNMGSQYFTLTTLDANSVIECRMTNSGGGPGQMVVDIFPQNLTGGTIGNNQSNCEAFTPTILSNLHPAYGGFSTTITYQWQESNDNINFTNISGASSLTYQPTLVSADKYYRRKATNANNEEGFSNVVFMDINGTTFYADVDGDGFGDPNNTVQACSAPVGYLTNNTDCNDNDTLERPGRVWYLDADNDGYVPNNTSITQCSRPLNHKAFSELLSNQRDCNDNNNHIHPGAQYLSFTGATNFVSHICNPLIGDAFTNFRYEVTYFNIYNEMPENGAPRLSVDLGQDFILNPGDKRVSMQQDDVNDTITQDGKKYFLHVSGIQPGVALQSYVSPHLINCDYFGPFLNEPLVVNFPNLSIAAADISFSNYNPDVSSTLTVTAVVRNPSSYSATNILVRLVNQFDTTQVYPIQTIAFIPNASDATVTWTITTPPLSALCPMKVIVDYGNTLSETNENDNSAIRGFVNGNGSVSGGISVTSSVSPKTILTGAGNPGNATLSGTAQYTGLALALNNAAVPGAEVTCTLIETGQTFMGVTDANGNFSIPFTAPIGAGTYHFSGTVYDFTWAGFMQVDSNAFTVVPAIGQSDLVPTLSMQSPSQTVVGEKIKVKYRSNNNGFISTTGNHKCKLSISGPSGFSLEDSTTLGVLVNNTSSPEILVETSVLNVSGTYIITVSTDTDDEEIESDESNNTSTSIVEVLPQQVDVIGQNVQVIGGNTLCNTQQITIQASIKNSGSIATSLAHVSTMTLKQGSTILGSQNFNIPVLQSNQEESISKTFAVPYTLGSYTVELSADINNVLIESNESNNITSFPITLDTCKADLSMAEFCNNVAIQAAGNDYSGAVTLKTIIKNNGDQVITQPVRVRFMFDNNSFFDYVHTLSIAPDDIVPIELPIAGIPANASSLQVVIDPLNTIDETSNTNNTSENKSLGLDFSPIAEGCVTPINGYSYYTGGFVTFYSSIKSANLFSRDSVKVKFQLSGPGISGLQTMGSTYIYNVSPTCFCPQVANIPTLHLISLPGTYQIHATVDPDNDIIETNETNNVIVYSITTQDLPDMHLNTTFINPSNLNPTAGQSITTQVTYGNLGVGNVGDTMKLKLYIDNVAIDSVLNATGLPSNGTTTYTFTTPWSSTQPGVHLIRTTIDEDNTITEINENNNMAVRAIVVGDAANMHFDSLGSLNLYPQLGDSALIYADIGNNGTLGCTSLLTFYFLNDFNDTLLIRNYTMTVAPNGHQVVTFKWKVIDEKTVVVAKLTNSTVQEFDYADNSASFAFGQMKLITEAIPACNAGNQGSITAHVLGGSPPFTYAWSNATNSSTAIGGPGTYSVTVFDQSGQQIQGSDSIPVCIGGLLYVKCLLQGFYAGNSTMHPVLTQSGLVSPLSFTDTITVELHENSAGFPLSSSFTGIIHSNGQINCHVPLSEIGTSRYLVIKHRNHIETWSANPVMISNNVVFDFSTAASQAFGDNQVEAEPGMYTLFSGDINHDNGIDAFDYLEMDPDIQNGVSGYLITDLNGDGTVDAFDYLVLDPNIVSGVGAITP